ncbi:MAG: B12-binding domain-containing radical SAM protein [Spirochaetales bacterium]|nr:B12-binding domain-containing radical SAM protein [Spirochaetales bacterium]
MKILLINPPRSNENGIFHYASADAKKFIHQKLIGPPLGLLTVAGAVRDHDVTVLDMKAEYDLHPHAPPPGELTRQYLEKINPDLVGVTFIASEFNGGAAILKTVKTYNHNILTIAGGLHATLCPEDFISTAADIICPGESAKIFREIVSAKQENKDVEAVAGILINKHNQLVPGKPLTTRYYSAGQDFIVPDRSFIKKWIQAYKIRGKIGPITYIFTSLGCPYNCSFCSIRPQYKGKFYQREIKSIIDEMQSIDPEYNVIRFADANTVVNPGFIHQLCDRILEENIKKELVIDIRVDTVAAHPDLIEKLAQCGLQVVICGFESYRYDELKKYNKDTRPELIEKAINILQANGIKIRGNYVIPPYYKEDDFKAMADYSNSHKVVYAGYTILTPMPGTVYYNQVKEQIIDYDLNKYNFFNSVLKTTLPLEEFYKNVSDLWLIKEGTDTI